MDILMSQKIEVPKEELDDLLSDIEGFFKDKPDIEDDFWFEWVNQKWHEITRFRKKYILGEGKQEQWAITETYYFNATNYERDYNGVEKLCGDFELFLSEEKAVEVFNKFRMNHAGNKRFRSGARWFSYRGPGIIHYQVKKVSEYDLDNLKEENKSISY